MRFRGVPIVPGVAHGTLWTPTVATGARYGTLHDFAAARTRVEASLAGGHREVETFYAALLADPMWEAGVERRLGRGEPLDAAIAATADENAATLAAIDDPYLRARAEDVIQLGAQLVRSLGTDQTPPRGAIVVTRDASPLELMRWSASVGGLVLLDVSPTAHVAIVARSLGVPAIVLRGDAARAAERAASDGDDALLHGFGGWLESQPDAALVTAEPARRIVAEADREPVTVGTRTIAVYANVNVPGDAPLGASLGADGIGLVRTEFLYVDRAAPPTFASERDAYAAIANSFGRKPIVVRALDIGADKRVPWLAPDAHADADAGMLGTRGIRLLLREPDLFRNHLRAVLAGFADRPFSLMFPMVAVPDEFARASAFVTEVAAETGARIPDLGIMLEIPAAAYALDDFARAGATFVSLGTNDLEQYVFAAGRLGDAGPPAETRTKTWHRYLHDVVRRARDAGLRVGVCGEAAADPTLAELWLATCVDSLSVSPGLIPWLKETLRANVRIPVEEKV